MIYDSITGNKVVTESGVFKHQVRRGMDNIPKEEEDRLPKNVFKEKRQEEAPKERKIKINNEAYRALDLSDIEMTDRFAKFISENMDMSDEVTRQCMFACNEAEQDRIMMSLTAKMYDALIDKADDIDFGEIPMSRGQMSKLSCYDKLQECMKLMYEMFKHFKENEAPLNTIMEAIRNVESREAIWKRAYNLNIELPMIMYNTTVMAIIDTIAYILAMCVDFIKSPGSDKFEVVIDKSRLIKSKNYMLYESLVKFNAACKNGSIDKAINACISNNVKNFVGGAALSIVGIVSFIVVVTGLLKEFVFTFYYSKVKISDKIEEISNMIELNAYNIESGDVMIKTGSDAHRVAEKQMAAATRFRKLANAIAIDGKTAEAKATNEIAKSKKKATADDVLDFAPDAVTSALF